MKLVRYGEAGLEKPGIFDQEGNIRDLSGHVHDIDGSVLAPDSLDKLASLKLDDLSPVEGAPRIGPPVANVGKAGLHRSQLSLARQRSGFENSRRAYPVYEGNDINRRTE